MSVLSSSQIADALTTLPGWRQQDDCLVREVTGADFAASIRYVNAVAAIAEAADHHPDLDIRWDTVTVRLSTHSKGGVTQADVDLAHAIDGLSA